MTPPPPPPPPPSTRRIVNIFRGYLYLAMEYSRVRLLPARAPGAPAPPEPIRFLNDGFSPLFFSDRALPWRYHT